MIAISILSVISLIVATDAFSGDVVANGGHVMVCPGRPPEVLEYHFANRNNPESVNYLKGKSADEVIQSVVNSLGQNEFRYALEQALREIGHPSTWYSLPKLDLVFDYGDDLNLKIWFNQLRQGCLFGQAAVRIGKNIILNGSIAAKLSGEQLGILALHEAIYMLSVARTGATNSFLARSLLQALITRSRNLSFYIHQLGYFHTTVVGLDTRDFIDDMSDSKMIIYSIDRNRLTMSVIMKGELKNHLVGLYPEYNNEVFVFNCRMPSYCVSEDNSSSDIELTFTGVEKATVKIGAKIFTLHKSSR